MSFWHPYLPTYQAASIMPNKMDTSQASFYLNSQLQLTQLSNPSFGNILFSWSPWPSHSCFLPISLAPIFHFLFSFLFLYLTFKYWNCLGFSLGHSSHSMFLPYHLFLWLHTVNQKMIIKFLSLGQISLLSSIPIYPTALVTSSLWYNTGIRNSTCATLNSWLSPMPTPHKILCSQ